MSSKNFLDASLDECATAIRSQVKLSTTNNNTKASKAADPKPKQTQNKKKSKDSEKAPPKAASPAQTYDRWNLKDESSISYGHFGQAESGGLPAGKDDGNTFYLTTAINYTNGPPHMGHAYEATTSDALARFARLEGKGPSYFVTGADEHGQKIATTAADGGKEPIEICDKYVTGFKCLNQRILVSNNDYVRTTSARHKRTAHALWEKCDKDIYLDAYKGWYNVREETFVTDSDAALSDYKDPVSGKPLKQVEEESYFFKMSAYQERLIKHIQDNPDFIRPEQHRNLILTRLQGDGLRDLSISRTTFSWGIPLPDKYAPNHVMYVWVDALSNYLTGVNGLGVNEDGSPDGLANFWPANVHIIGKDILWFHTVIWPCLLMSAGIPLPKTVFAHGFVNDKEGKKMSKSLGNVVDPHDMLDKYPVDSFRWYLCKEAPYGGELSFSEESLRDMHNADLCDTLGNLIHRATNLCQKYCGGKVPDVPVPPPIVDLKSLVTSFQTKMTNFELEAGSSLAIQGFREVNGYLTTEAPWLLKGDEHAEKRQIIVRATLEAIYALTHLLTPFLPIGCAAIFDKLQTKPVTLAQLKTDSPNLVVGTPVQVGEVLYSKLLSEEEKARSAAESAKKKKESYEEAQRKKKEKKAKAIAASQAGQASVNQPDFTKIDIRVGQIVKVWNHETADKLFCEEIDLGEEGGPRQIASGLRQHYTLEEMQDKKVLVVCNLKAAKIVGFTSNGMVLAAKGGDDKVELVTPPDDAKIGEKVYIEGLEGEPITAAQVKKKKVWETVAKDLETKEGGVACWKGKVILTSAGPCSASSLVGAPIS